MRPNAPLKSMRAFERNINGATKMRIRTLLHAISLSAMFLCQLSGCKPSIEDKDPDVRKAAIEELTDQNILARVASDDIFDFVCEAAVKKLTDQRALEYVAITSRDEKVHKEAVDKLNDLSLRKKLGDKMLQPFEKLVFIAALDDTDPVLKYSIVSSPGGNPKFWRFFASTWKCVRPYVSLANLKLATQEPGIKSKFPRLRCIAKADSIEQSYTSQGSYGGGIYIYGERIITQFRQDNEILAIDTSLTSFKERVSQMEAGFIQEAYVNATALLRQLFHRPEFTQEDLKNLLHSDLLFIRAGALANITDQDLLSKEINDVEEPTDMQEAAIYNLTDTTLLAKIANDFSPSTDIAISAKKRILELARKK
jgi:hypothetical protein